MAPEDWATVALQVSCLNQDCSVNSSLVEYLRLSVPAEIKQQKASHIRHTVQLEAFLLRQHWLKASWQQLNSFGHFP